MRLLYLLLFLASGILNFAFTLRIVRELAADRPSLGFFDLRWYVLRNLNRYRDLTRQKYGRVGPAYYGYLATVVILALSAALLLQSLA